MIADDWPSAFPLSRPRRLVPLVLGHEPIAESISLRGGDPARFLLEPVTGAAIDLGDSWILIDGGFHLDRVRDPAQRAAHYDYESYTAVVPPGDALAEQVAAAGLRWEDLALVALSHLHLDHTGGLRLAPAGTPEPVIRKLEQEIARAVADPEVKKRIQALGMVPTSNTSAAFTKIIQDEVPLWKKVAKENNISAD